MLLEPQALRRIWPQLLAPMLVVAGAVVAPGVLAQTPAAPDGPAAPPGSTLAPTHAVPETQPPAPAAPGAPTGVPAAPILLSHPSVVDTAHLKGDETVVTLFGVQGWAGDPARSLQSFITANGDRVTCRPQDGGAYTCVLPTGVDVAATALANGAAQTVADSPGDYRRQQASAQAAHLGIWAVLPSAPVVIQHPVVQTTASLVGDGRLFPLDGLVGFSAQYYTLQLQNYIKAHGDKVSCQQKPGGDRFVCALPDGTDVATVALLQGLARVAPNASEAYRADQAKAVASKSGFWFEAPRQAVADLPLPPGPVCCNYAPGDIGEGIAYDDGLPVAVIDNEPVFFLYSDLFGFGFFDQLYRWHPAPEPFRAHLERFHPRGEGLPGFRSSGTPSQAAALGIAGPAVARGPAVFNGPDDVRRLESSNAAAAFHNPEILGPPDAAGRDPSSHGVMGSPPISGAQIRRPVILHFATPNPAFAGGFHPGLARAPNFARPAMGFIGRH